MCSICLRLAKEIPWNLERQELMNRIGTFPKKLFSERSVCKVRACVKNCSLCVWIESEPGYFIRRWFQLKTTRMSVRGTHKNCAEFLLKYNLWITLFLKKNKNFYWKFCHIYIYILYVSIYRKRMTVDTLETGNTIDVYHPFPINRNGDTERAKRWMDISSVGVNSALGAARDR